jgi:hypothetical protein
VVVAIILSVDACGDPQSFNLRSECGGEIVTQASLLILVEPKTLNQIGYGVV